MTISLDDKSEKQCLHELVCYGCTHHAGLPSLYGLPTPCPFDVQCLKPFQHLFEFIFYLIFCAINRFFFFLASATIRKHPKCTWACQKATRDCLMKWDRTRKVKVMEWRYNERMCTNRPRKGTGSKKMLDGNVKLEINWTKTGGIKSRDMKGGQICEWKKVTGKWTLSWNRTSTCSLTSLNLSPLLIANWALISVR